MSPLCTACLVLRTDVSQDWLEQQARGHTPTTCYCNDDLAFPAIMIMVEGKTCPGCKSQGPVLAVTDEIAASVQRYLKIRGD